MLTGTRLKEKSKLFSLKLKTLAHPHRLAIIYLLAHGPLWVRDLVMHLNIPQNLIAHHLKVLLHSGWVSKTREGRHAEYRLNEKAFFELNRFLADSPFERDVLSNPTK